MRIIPACGCILVTVAIAACGSSAKPGTSGPPTAAQGLAFAACMRAHGLSDFPDSIAGHAMQFNLPQDLNPDSPAFKAAGKSCRSLIPSPRAGGGGVPAGQQAAALSHADCMRSHGVSNYPDPTYLNGRPTVEPLSNYGIDDESPAFLNAAKACGGE